MVLRYVADCVGVTFPTFQPKPGVEMLRLLTKQAECGTHDCASIRDDTALLERHCEVACTILMPLRLLVECHAEIAKLQGRRADV